MRSDTISSKLCWQCFFFKKAFKATVAFIFPYWLVKWGTQRDFCILYLYEIHSLPFVSWPSVVYFKADTHSLCVFLWFGKCVFQSTASNESRPHYPQNRHFLSVFTINQIQKISNHKSYNDCTMVYWYYEKIVSMSMSSNSAPFVLHINNYFSWL